MKLIIAILAFVAVVTGFATMPANATTPERMTYSGDAFLRDATWFEAGNDFVLSDGGGRRQ